MPLLTRKKLIGVQLEDTSGTYQAPSGAAALQIVENLTLSLDDPFGDGERRPMGHYLGHADRIRGRLGVTVSFTTLVYPSDVTASLLRAAGAVLNTTVYEPTSALSSRKTASVIVYEDGRAFALRGAAADVTFEFTAGGPLRANWTLTGVPVLAGNLGSQTWPTDTAMPAQAPNHTRPYKAESMTLTLASFEPRIANFTLAFGNTVSLREDTTEAEGNLAAIITERNPTVTMDPEAELVATHSAYGLLLNGTTFALTAALPASATETLEVTAPRCQRIGVTDADRDGRLIDEIECQLNASDGDDEWSFEFQSS